MTETDLMALEARSRILFAKQRIQNCKNSKFFGHKLMIFFWKRSLKNWSNFLERLTKLESK
jgi:hypothetical protein